MRPVPAPSFYLPVGPPGEGRYVATAATGGPWDPRAQHGGPPAALLARAVETLAPRDDVLVARLTCEILGPVPVGELRVEAAVVRPGRSVELVEASLTAGGRTAARMLAWRVVTTPADVPVDGGTDDTDDPPALPEVAHDVPLDSWYDGYLSAVEWRFVAGSFGRPGPATVWTRARVPLLPDEEISPLQRVALVADSGNGVSNVLEIDRWWFINPELTVHLHRYPEGEWVALDARTTIAPGGAGLAQSSLWDGRGRIGAGAQALYVGRR